MAKGRGGLGRGLESLFEDAAPSFESDTRIETLPLREIEPDPGQPRKTFDDETLAELSASIAEHGLLQPIAVRPKPSGGYLIVAGERRWRASRMAGLTEVPVIVKDVTDEQAMELAKAIENAKVKLHRCRLCQDYTANEVCSICASPKRDRSVICVVESPRDVKAIERTHEFNGLYHVLHGLISPMDGIGADQLCVKELLARLDGTVKEVIMATSPTVEGEATAMYLAKLIKPMGIKTTRLAYGLPVGASLEYTDETTLYRALSGRGEL